MGRSHRGFCVDFLAGAAIAMGEVLRGLYQQFAARLETRRERGTIDDFGNP